MTPEQRFWAKVDKRGPDECWPWLAYRKPEGYGRFWFCGRDRSAPVIALVLSGVTIPDGCEPDHTCYNPPCVNPAHLDVVTSLENIRRGRARRRLLCQTADKPATHNASLTADQVRAIRADPRGWRKLSKILPFSKWAIKDVKDSVSYKHIL